jgi:hypothetical protein
MSNRNNNIVTTYLERMTEEMEPGIQDAPNKIGNPHEAS